MNKHINSFILSKINKVEQYKEEFQGSYNNIDDAPESPVIMNLPITSRDFGKQPKVYQEILQQNEEYFDLSTSNRPIQTFEQSVYDIKRLDKLFLDLKNQLKTHNLELQQNYDIDAFKEGSQITTLMNSIIESTKNVQIKSIDRVRRSYRSQLSDLHSRIVLEAQKELEHGLKITLEQNQSNQKENEKRLSDCKRNALKAADEVAKLRAQVTKFASLIKKNNLQDVETISMAEDAGKIKAGDLIDFYQQSITQKEQQIFALQSRIDILQSTSSGIEDGVEFCKMPQYIYGYQHQEELLVEKDEAANEYENDAVIMPFRMFNGIQVYLLQSDLASVERQLNSVVSRAVRKVTDKIDMVKDETENMNELMAEKFKARRAALNFYDKKRITKHWDVSASQKTLSSQIKDVKSVVAKSIVMVDKSC